MEENAANWSFRFDSVSLDIWILLTDFHTFLLIVETYFYLSCHQRGSSLMDHLHRVNRNDNLVEWSRQENLLIAERESKYWFKSFKGSGEKLVG